MGIKSNRVLASYFNRFGATGLDAVSPAPVPVYTEATGGIISDYTDSGTHYRAHIFTSSGTFTVTQVGDVDTVDYLVVGGGGGGSSSNGGGGAASAAGAPALPFLTGAANPPFATPTAPPFLPDVLVLCPLTLRPLK